MPPKSLRVLRPRTGWQAIDLREIWRYRDLLGILALRDIQVRYKQTALGAVWAIIQPLATVVVFTILFGRLLGVGQRVEELSNGVPYAVFLYSGQLPWILFASIVAAAGISLVAEADMLRRVYFPRLLMPLAAAGAPLVDYLLGFVVFLGVLLWYGLPLTWHLFLLPLLLLSTVVAALGVGILLAALTVSYRDFKYVLPFMIQIWFFVTPVIYPVNILSEEKRWILYLNPMFGPIEGFRAVFVGTSFDLFGWCVSSAMGVAMLVVAVAFFSRVERNFADIA